MNAEAQMFTQTVGLYGLPNTVSRMGSADSKWGRLDNGGPKVQFVFYEKVISSKWKECFSKHNCVCQENILILKKSFL